MKINSKTKLILWLIILFGLFIRLIGINWDQGQHLHPDERFLTMVLTDIKMPTSLPEYLNPQISPINPYNHNFPFFVYGSLPINLIKLVGETLNLTSYDQIYLVGRVVTILLDVAIIFLIFWVCHHIFNNKTGVIASFFYSISVLPIQLSHFYTVDPFLNFFVFLSFYFLILLANRRHTFLKVFLLSFSFGAALACKISAVYFGPIILIYFIFLFKKNLRFFFSYGLIFTIFTLLSFRFNQPQAFSTGSFLNWTPNSQFINNLQELKSFNNNPYYPPSIQWLKTTPIITPFKNITLWGLGIPLSLFFIGSLTFSIHFLFKNKIKKNFNLFIITFWIIFLFIIQGSQFVTTLRYFLFIFPFISILSAFLINYLINKYHFLQNKNFIFIFILVLLVYPLSFISIFLKNHSRVTASNWIYQNIPSGSVIATEYWDDTLPLSIGNNLSYQYQYQSLHVADIEDENKIDTLKNQIENSDYIILSSNRFYLPIPQNAEIFPNTAKYYQSLFDGSLGFQKVAEFSSYPCFPPTNKPLFCLNDTSSEEAFTVYDHPKVLIFKKIKTVSTF